ncbi:hypothetical protein MTR62_20715, partial [Novosphingobium sp. 1949]
AAAVEALAAIALVLAPTHRGGAVAAIALWGLYTALLLVRRGQRLDCGCDLAARTRPVGAATIARPFALALLGAVALALRAPLDWALDTPFAALALLALWFAAGELSALPFQPRTR